MRPLWKQVQDFNRKPSERDVTSHCTWSQEEEMLFLKVAKGGGAFKVQIVARVLVHVCGSQEDYGIR